MKSSLKYIFSTLSLIVLCLSCTVAQAKGKTDWEEDGLKGKVKEMRVYNVHETTSGIEKAFIRHKIKYDKKGNRLEEEHYNENDEKKEPITYIYKYKSKKDRLFKYKYKYRYDTNDTLLLEKTIYIKLRDGKKLKLEETIFSYDIDDKYIENEVSKIFSGTVLETSPKAWESVITRRGGVLNSPRA